MAFNKSYKASTAGYIKLEQACVRHRLGIQQGDYMAQLTLNSLTQTQFEPLFCLPAWFPYCSWETDWSPEHSWDLRLLLSTFPCRSIADKSVVSLEKAALQSFGLLSLPKSQWGDTPVGQAKWVVPSLCPEPVHTASCIAPEDKAHPEVLPPAKII